MEALVEDLVDLGMMMTSSEAVALVEEALVTVNFHHFLAEE